MSGSTIKEYLIGFGFQLDETGADGARRALEEIIGAAKAMEAQIKGAAAAAAIAMDAFAQSVALNRDISLNADTSGLIASLAGARAAVDGFLRTANVLPLKADASGFISSIAAARASADALWQTIANLKRASLDGIVPDRLALKLDISGFLSSVASARASLDAFIAAAQLNRPSLDMDASRFLAMLTYAGDAFSNFKGVINAESGGLNDLEISLDVSKLGAAARTVQSEMAAARKAVNALSGNQAFAQLSAGAVSAFRKISASVKNEMKSAAEAVAAQAQKMRSALNALSDSMGKAGASGPKFSLGGMVEKETRATIGEDGREYVIPVTKPDRAIPLLKAAMKDLNVDGRAALGAVGQLGGSATANKAPAYQNIQTVTRETVNNKVVNHNVSAPATINVYGSDAESVARNVERNQETLLIRNIKGVYA